MTFAEAMKEELSPETVITILDKYIFNNSTINKQNFSNIGKEKILQKRKVLENSNQPSDRILKNNNISISKQDFLNKFSILADKYNNNKQVALDLCELLIKNFKEDGKL